MNPARTLGQYCLAALVAGSASSCGMPTSQTEPAAPAVVPARWEPILLAHPRHRHTATVLADGRVLIAGGDDEESINTTEIYEPTAKTLTSGPQLLGRHIWHAAAAIAGGVLIAGGLDLGDASRADVSRGKATAVGDTSDASIVGIDNRGSASSVGSMMFARQNFTMTPLLDGTVLVFGGAGRGAETTAEIFDPRTRRFARTGDILVKRFGCPATIMTDGRVLLTGGTSADEATYNARIADAEMYDPLARTFTKTGSMKRSRWGHTSTLLPDGRVLIAGGINEEEGITASAELYDPKNGMFREIPPMRLPRSGHAAVLLADGRVLIMGGASHIGRSDMILRSAEVFDTSLEKFVETEPMRTAREDHSATLLKTGEVLVVGGWTGGNSENSGELFRLGR